MYNYFLQKKIQNFVKDKNYFVLLQLKFKYIFYNEIN